MRTEARRYVHQPGTPRVPSPAAGTGLGQSLLGAQGEPALAAHHVASKDCEDKHLLLSGTESMVTCHLLQPWTQGTRMSPTLRRTSHTHGHG